MIHCPNCGEENPPKFRLCGYCGTPLAPAAAAPQAREVRRTVTIVFSDLKGSTALGELLDAEALHEVKARYFDAMAAEIARHGGKIEKYVGDAIMAVFGLPRAHEDDALRAVRAAAGMQAALRRVNQGLLRRYGVELASRTGVNTGEVVANDDPNATQKLATGDAVNVAARLEQAAPENQTYIGEATFRLARDAIDAEPVAPLELKGKAERVGAYRLVAVHGIEGSARRIDTPIVGRDDELAALDAVYREACESRTTRLATVIGDAGVGKSRLVHEVVERFAAGAQVLRGRCLPYGDGITFWPLIGMVTQAADIRADDTPDDACIKLIAAVGHADVAERLASATGFATASFPLHEIYWAARKFLETIAADGPLIAVIDDIHWAEQAFLDLLEHVRDHAVDAPILLLATARHDLLEVQPDWGTRPSEARLLLRPLGDAEAAQVVANLLGSSDLPADLIARIVGGADGNPLFVEQMLAMLIDSHALRMEGGRWVRGAGGTEITVPPTIHALLEARLDQLGRDVRAAVEPASVIGFEFAQAAVESLLPESLRPAIGEKLATLTRKQLIRPAASTADADVVYRFHQHLVRDTVYGGLLKRARATLHTEFVRWADRVNAERERGLEYEEILGYHLEQAHRYLLELGPLDDKGIAIGSDAARRLAAAGRRAFGRGDMHAASNLLRRAVALLDPNDAGRLELLPGLGEALMELGEFAAARSVLDEAVAAADRASMPRAKAAAQLVGMLVQLHSGEQGNWSDDAQRLANEVIPLLEREGIDEELANAWRLIAMAQQIAGRHAQAAEAIERVIEHARRAGNERLVARSGLGLSFSALFGPTPVPQAIAQCEAIVGDGMSDRQVESLIGCKIAQLKAMNGEFETARSLYRRARALLRELGEGVLAASTGLDLVVVESLAGDLATAEREARADYEFLESRGETYFLSTLAALLARVVRDQGRDDEALALSKAAEAAAAEDDLDAQVLWRSIRAPIVARAGDCVAAEAFARAALALARTTEIPVLQADALCDLAAVLSIAGRPGDARQAIADATAIYASKGDIVSVARWVAWAGQLGSD